MINNNMIRSRRVCLNIIHPNHCEFGRHMASIFTNSRTPVIVKEDIKLPSGNAGKPAFLLHNVLAPEECENLIKETEEQGYLDEVITVKNISGEKVIARHSKRCIIDSVEYSNEIWKRIHHFVPTPFRNRRIVGLNERLRFLRYDPGDFFVPHCDGVFLKRKGEWSVMTLQLYLNEGFQGGATKFIGSSNDTATVIPKTGLALVFQHMTDHEEPLFICPKYTIRGNIMLSIEPLEAEY